MKTLVISPTYNEKKSITKLIDKLFSLKLDFDLLIIDDNSPDGTADIVKEIMKKNKNIYLINRKQKLGLGTAYCEGFKFAIKNDYKKIIQMDADLSHNPHDIVKMIKLSNDYDLVIGSRYVDGVNVVNWPMNRLLLSYFANLYARYVTFTPIFDITGGFKCFNQNIIKSLNLDTINSEGYSFQIEINYLAHKKGFKIKEMPIIFTDRTVGESKMNKSIIIEAILIVPKLLFKRIFNIR